MFAAAVVVATVSADDARQIGHSEGTTVFPPRDPCSGTLVFNHDGSFESAYAWESYGAWPEYYGAWGESYDFGECQAVCGAYWVTTVPGYYIGQPASLYIWEGGVANPPGAVLFVLPGVHFESIPIWPQMAQNDVAIGASVAGEFTIGFWGDWGPPFSVCGFVIGADEDGGGGRPWTYIAPGIGYPTGWHHPNVVFADCRSVGIGLYTMNPIRRLRRPPGVG